MATSKRESTPSTAQAWKKKAAGIDLAVPSGNTAKVRPVGIQVFLQRGIIPNSLMPIITEAISGGKQVSIKDMGMDHQKLKDTVQLFDDVTCYVVVEPKVSAVPKFNAAHLHEGICKEEEVGNEIPLGHELRDEGTLYVDEVDMDDKMFIFQWAVGGTKDVESFRAEQAAMLESVR